MYIVVYIWVNKLHVFIIFLKYQSMSICIFYEPKNVLMLCFHHPNSIFTLKQYFSLISFPGIILPAVGMSLVHQEVNEQQFFQDHLLGPLLEFGQELYFFTIEDIEMCLQLCGNHTYSWAYGPIGSESSMAKQEASWVPLRQKFLLTFFPKCVIPLSMIA